MKSIVEAGRYWIHVPTGIAGKVARVWEAGAWPPDPKPGEPRIPHPCVEFEDGNVLLDRCEEEPGTFEELQEREVLYYRQLEALLRHAVAGAVPLGRALGLELPRVRRLLANALARQCRTIQEGP